MESFLTVAVVLIAAVGSTEIDSSSDDSRNKLPKEYQHKGVKYYWNVPTFQCDSFKMNFSKLAEKYGIIQNDQDRFRGAQIAILYDPGAFPAILKDKTRTILRNGGVPQEGNLTFHLETFKTLVRELIPPEDFSGLAVIDFESWRPVFRQNFGTLAPYKELSMEVERQKHPFWPKLMVEKEAVRRFELYARRYMEETLVLGKKLRPKATWGYYAYPYCFNMSPSNMRMACPGEVQSENNKIGWLFETTDSLHPSIYLTGNRLSARERTQMVEGRLHESHRVVSYVKKKFHLPKIVPYFWYKYQDSKNFVSKDDLYNTFRVISSSKVDGLVIWGSSNDVSSRTKCENLYKYVDGILGPILVESFN